MSDDASNIVAIVTIEAWDKGYEAGRRDLTQEANPYAVAARAKSA